MFTEHMFERIAEIPRDRWGRPLINPPGGGKPIAYTRCTTFVDAIEDKYNLQKWMQRMVAVGIATDPALRASAAAMSADMEGNKQALDQVCDQARIKAGAEDKASIGTALHNMTQTLDLGRTLAPEIVGEYATHILNYQTATHGFTHHHIEQITVCDELQVAGTPDRISALPGQEGVFILDLKTGPSTLKFGLLKVAMQMAVYAHSSLYDVNTGTRQPIPGIRQDKGLVIGLDSTTGQCELHWIDLEAGWEAAQLSGQIRAWRARKDLAQPYQPISPADQLTELIWATKSRAEALDLWEANTDSWTDAHTSQMRIHLGTLETQQ